ncbi:MAG: metallophosphoesterase family protein [Puniceicoccales bacterium]
MKNWVMICGFWGEWLVSLGRRIGSALGRTGRSGMMLSLLLSGGVCYGGSGDADGGECCECERSVSGGEEATAEEMLIEWGAIWSYLDDGSDMGSRWISRDFDASGWRKGAGQLGYGEGDESTVIRFGDDPEKKHFTSYFRHDFVIGKEELAALVRLKLSVLRDDGVVVYLNGVEIARDRMDHVQFDYMTRASGVVAGEEENRILEYLVDHGLLLVGRNILAAEVHQQRSDSSDVSFDLSLQGIRARDQLVVGAGKTWKYYEGERSPEGDWDLAGYDDSAWAEGLAPFGSEDAEDVTQLSRGTGGSETAYYFRTRFEVEWLELVEDLFIELQGRGTMSVFLNGLEVVPEECLDTGTGRGAEEVAVFSYFLPDAYLVEGENCVAVKLVPGEIATSDSRFDLRMVLRGGKNPDTVRFRSESVEVEPVGVLEEFSWDLTENLVNRDGDEVAYRLIVAPEWVSLGGDGLLHGVPGPTDEGAAEVVLSVTDDDGASVLKMVVPIVPAPEWPRAPLPGIEGDEAVAFAVIPDTQGSWDGVPLEEVNAIASRIIEHSPEFVIHVGDVTDGNSSNGDVKLAQLEYLKELLVEPLADEGIGFYPVRGNHDSNAYLQTSRGVSAWAAAFPYLFEGENPLVDPADVPGGSPESPNDSNFCYVYSPNENVFFVSVDQWNGGDDTNYSDWVERKFAEIRGQQPHAHIFGFSHSGLFSTSIHPAMSEFVEGGATPYLAAGEKFQIDGWFSGHNHIYDRSMAVNLSKGNLPYLFDFTCGSASEKFYGLTRVPSEDQHLNHLVDSTVTVGRPITYLFAEIVGPFVQIVAYMSPDTNGHGAFDDWSVWDAYTYSRNGKQFTVAAGENYSDHGIEDQSPKADDFVGTTVALRDGVNSDRRIYIAEGERFSPYRNITTGWWKTADWYDPGGVTLVSDIVSIHGMRNDAIRNRSDTYTLVLGLEESAMDGVAIEDLRIVAFLDPDLSDEDEGEWVEAVRATLASDFPLAPIFRSPRMNDPLGAWGIDRETNTVWARLDYQGDFAIASGF